MTAILSWEILVSSTRALFTCKCSGDKAAIYFGVFQAAALLCYGMFFLVLGGVESTRLDKLPGCKMDLKKYRLDICVTRTDLIRVPNGTLSDDISLALHQLFKK